MAEQDESLRTKQPWKAAYERDYAWLGGVIEKHYAGDDSDVKVLLGGMLQAFAGQTVDEYAASAAAFLDAAPHPTLGRRLRDCAYVPMVELLRYLEAHGFTCFIASGGSRDFMRAITDELYGVPPAARDRQLQRAPLRRRRARRRAHVPRGARLLRRRPRQAGADLEPHRAPADRRRRELERRRADAPLHRREGPAGAPPARPPRRPRAGVRLREGRRAGARARPGRELDGRQRQGGLGDGLRASRRRRPRASSGGRARGACRT